MGSSRRESLRGHLTLRFCGAPGGKRTPAHHPQGAHQGPQCMAQAGADCVTGSTVPERALVTLLTEIETGSHRVAVHHPSHYLADGGSSHREMVQWLRRVPQGKLARCQGVRGRADRFPGAVGWDAHPTSSRASAPGSRRASCVLTCSTASSRSRRRTPWPMPGARLRGAGVLIGISSGACLAAIAQLLGEVPDGSRILTSNYDSRDRHLSIDAPWQTH